MAYNLDLERRIDAVLGDFETGASPKFSKKKMFGGLAYLYSGKMTVGVLNNDLMVRVVSGKMENVLRNQHVRPMDFTRKPMKEFVYVAQDGIKTQEQLYGYIELGLEHARKVLNEL